MKRAVALWILKTRGLHRIPQSVMDEMLGDIQSLFQMSLSGISERIRATLSEASIEESISKTILSHLNGGPPFYDIFKILCRKLWSRGELMNLNMISFNVSLF